MVYHPQIVRTSRGFTLLELLITIAVIAILAAVIIASLSSSRAAGRDADRISQLRQLQNAAQLYFSSNGTYAATKGLLIPNYITEDPGDEFYYTGLLGNDGVSCTKGFHIGVDLEKDNKVLDSDSDFNSAGSGVRCGGPAIRGQNETGASPAGCDNNSTGQGNYCYDIEIEG